MTAIFKTPYFMYSFDLKWTVCVQICCTLFNLKGKKWFWVCVHIDEPPLISIRIDELQPHLLFLKNNPFIVHFLWTCILFELSTLDDIHTEHLMMFSTDIKKYF